VDNTVWPEFLELQVTLRSYLNEATERIIREEVSETRVKRRNGLDNGNPANRSVVAPIPRMY
jgi:hypothetical protein